MKRHFYLILTLFICFIGTMNVDATTTTTTTKKTVIATTKRTTTTSPFGTTTKAACTIEDRAKINKQAYAVTSSYDFTKDANGNVVFNLSVYNITGDIYVVIESDVKDAEKVTVFPSQTRGGTYTWQSTDTKNIINYTIKVKSTLGGCIGDYRTVLLSKPKKNPYYGTDACSYAGLEDYYYCTEWITQEFNLTEEEIEEKIKNELSKYTTSLKTRCISCEREELLAKAKAEFEATKKLIISVLIVLIIADIAAIIILVKRIKRYEL